MFEEGYPKKDPNAKSFFSQEGQNQFWGYDEKAALEKLKTDPPQDPPIYTHEGWELMMEKYGSVQKI